MATKKEMANEINKLQKELGLNQVLVEELENEHKHADLNAMLKKLQEYEADDPEKDENPDKEEGDEKDEKPKPKPSPNGSLDLKKISVKDSKVVFSYTDGSKQEIPWVEDNRKFLLDLFRQCNNEAVLAQKPDPNNEALKRIAVRYFAEGARMSIKVDHIKAANVRKLFESQTGREDMLKHKAISIDDCKAIVNEFSNRYKVQGYVHEPAND